MNTRTHISWPSMAFPTLSFVLGTGAVAWMSPVAERGMKPDEITVFLGAAFLTTIFLHFWSSSKESQLLPSYLLVNILFFVTGYIISGHEFRQFSIQSDDLSAASIAEGTIARIDHFAKMDRIQVKIPSRRWQNRAHYFNVNLLDKDHDLIPGAQIRVNNRLSPITKSTSPFDFDAYTYWKYQHTSHQIFLYDAGSIEIKKKAASPILYRVRQQLSQKIDDRFNEDEKAGLIKALLLGDKNNVSSEDKTHFKNTGLLHILAVSGLHVGIVSLLILLLLYPMRIYFPDSRFHWILMIAMIWCYAVLTGLHTPVVRASILITFFMVARTISRKGQSWNIFFWAVLLVLAMDPFALFTVSFQLSFGAVASILLFYKYIQRWLSAITGKNYLSNLAAVSIAAQMGLFPLLIYHFKEVSTVGFISSLLVIPLLLPVIFSTSLTLALPAGIFFTDLMKTISWILLDLIQTISTVLSQWQFSSQILVWHPLTLIAIGATILLLAVTLQQIDPRIKKWSFSLFIFGILLSFASESVNLYLKRHQTIITISQDQTTPVIDIYHKGFCYTNHPDPGDAERVKLRKKYYIKHVTNPLKDNEWTLMITAIREKIQKPGSGMTLISLANPYSSTDPYFTKSIADLNKGNLVFHNLFEEYTHE